VRGQRPAIKKIILTQSHEDHIGGWHTFNAPDIETIAQANYSHVSPAIGAAFGQHARRSRHLWSRDQTKTVVQQPDPIITNNLLSTRTAFSSEAGVLKLYSTRGGETLDSLIV